MVQYTEWRSISDGSIISDIPDAVVLPESGDLDHFEGDVGDFDINSDSPVIFTEVNDLSLKNVSPSGMIVSTSGLPNYPERDGTKHSVFYQADDDEPNAFLIVYAEDTSSNGYAVQINVASNELRFFEDFDDFNQIGSTSVSLDFDEWYDVEIEADADELTARIFDVESDGRRDGELGSLTVEDDSYDGSGIGFQSGSGSGLFSVDFWRLGGGLDDN